jgi:THAP4-like, heme-binding beta-barrel domain
MIELPVGLPAELVPLSWLIGVWEGSGVIDYKVGEESITHEFGQRVSFSHDGMPHLNYTSYTWLFPQEPDGDPSPLATETGYWRIERELGEGDAGPALLPAVGASRFPDAESVETLRNTDGGFDLEVSLVHPGGVATDAVMRTAGAKDYAAATRLYGLVDGHLLWAWDIAALGQDLRTHASARLAKAD